MSELTTIAPSVKRAPQRPARFLAPLPEPRDIDIPLPPTRSAPQSAGQSIMQMAFPVVGSAGSMIFVLANPNPLAIVGAGVFMVAAIAMGVGMFTTQRATNSRKTRDDRATYLNQLAEIRVAVRSDAEQEQSFARTAHPGPERLLQVSADPHQRFMRRPADPDFLTVRLGTGDVAAAVQATMNLNGQQSSRFDPVSLTSARDLAENPVTIPGHPVAVNLREAGVVTLVGDPTMTRHLASQMVLTIATLHAPWEVAIAAVVPPNQAQLWNWLRWLPHIHGFDPDKTMARVGATCAALQEFIDADVRAMTARGTQHSRYGRAERLDQHLIVFIESEHVPDYWTLSALGSRTPPAGGGVTFVHLVPDVQHEPARVDVRIQVDGRAMTMLRADAAPQSLQADSIDRWRFEAIGRSLAAASESIVEGQDGASATGPEFGPLVDVRDLNSLDIPRLWAPRQGADRLVAPLGVDDEGHPVLLDLKESALGGMGPHGLIVGATGSGKSQLLRSLVAALAVTHSPDELALVMVDFKGGSTFAGLEELPHNQGLVTNLSDDLMLVDRMRDALYGETLRRQEVLKDAGNLGNVHDYNRLRATSNRSLAPLPSLLVIIDEFAELLTANPDFADLFAMIGRIGRSIGIHLLLASQRLDVGKIRGLESHLSYRIGMRTFSAAESRDAIGSDDAYKLPPVPGLGYLRVDTTVFRKFRAPFVSAPATVTETSLRAVPRAPSPRVLTLYPQPSAEIAPTDTAVQTDAAVGVRSQLDVVVEQLAAARPRGAQIWLPPLPSTLHLSPAAGHPLTACFGIVDLPLKQRVDDLTLDFSGGCGHLAVVGAPQSGKSTLLRSLVQSLALTTNSRQCGLYILDFGGGGLTEFELLPHCAVAATRADRELVERTVAELVLILHRREELFRRERINSTQEFRDRHAAGEFPDEAAADLFLIIDGNSVIRAEFEALEALVADLAARALRYGIHVLVAANRWAEIRANLSTSIDTSFELRLTDAFESQFGRANSAKLTSAPAGRGITREGAQFQVALPEFARDAERPALQESLLRNTTPAVPRVKVLPSLVRHFDLPQSLPRFGQPTTIGLLSSTLAPAVVDFFGSDKHLLIFGDGETGKTNLLKSIMAQLAAASTAAELLFAIVDYRHGLLEVLPEERLLGYASSAPAAQQHITDIAAGLRDRLPPSTLTPAQLRARDWWQGPEIVVIVDDYDIVPTATENPLAPLAEFLPNSRDVGLHVVLARRSSGAARAAFDPLIQRLRDLGTAGVLFSGDKREGPLLGGLAPADLPVGRAIFVPYRKAADVVQTTFVD